MLSGRIAGDGSVSGTLSGTNLALAGSRSIGSSTAQAVAGFYQAGQVNGSGVTYTIVSATGATYVLTITPAGTDAGMGTATGSGSVSVVTPNNTTFTGTLNASASTLSATVTPPGGQASEFVGGSASRPVLEKLLNISTRARVGVGGDVLIAGFVISGSVPKQILVRAIGPGLGAFGVAGTLTAPRLEVASGSTTLATNSGWSTSANASTIVSVTERAGGFALAPGSADSALLLTLDPGGYTAIASGVGGATGVALIEVYDVSDNTTPGQKVVNLSARAVAGAGNDSLIAGYNISGTVPKRVLVRAVGPALASGFGVTGALTDPQLRIVRASDGATVASNDNWGDSAGAEIAAASVAVGAFAFAENSRDAALLINLPPGSYSAVVTGAGTSSGVALVEVYEVP